MAASARLSTSPSSFFVSHKYSSSFTLAWTCCSLLPFSDESSLLSWLLGSELVDQGWVTCGFVNWDVYAQAKISSRLCYVRPNLGQHN